MSAQKTVALGPDYLAFRVLCAEVNEKQAVAQMATAKVQAAVAEAKLAATEVALLVAQRDQRFTALATQHGLDLKTTGFHLNDEAQTLTADAAPETGAPV